MKTLFAHIKGKHGTHNNQQHPQHLQYIRLAVLLCSLAALFSACSLFPQTSETGGGTDQTGPSVTPTATHAAAATPTYVPPTITLQVTNCPTLAINWDALVGTHSGVNKVQQVTCGSIEGAGSLAALVNVRYYAPGAKLDVYVYDNLAGTPNRSFSVQGLYNGDAVVSSINTVSTAEVSPKDTVKGAPDLFKDYAWNGSGFAQDLFPGIYPEMTQYQADKTQTLINNELANPNMKPVDAWQLSPTEVTSHLASTIFHWGSYTQQSLTPNIKKQVTITVSVTNTGSGGGGFTAILNRLDGNVNNILEVTQITPFDTNIALSSPAVNATLHSPISVSGSATAAGSVLGEAVVYDDMYVQVGTSGSIASPSSSGYVQFSKSVNFQLNASGEQEGVVAFYETSQNNALLSNQVVLIKVFLTA
ncbi:MAG TPA: hypothetical protein DHW02_07260 [Ktedonobacter sp.]|nr:hypothetical protein [Ktedonobacter sp.]